MWLETLDSLLLAQEATGGPKWYQQTIPMLLMMLAALALSITGGYYYARSIRMSDYGWKLSLMFACVLCAIIIIVGKFPPKFGVDLEGGVTFIGQLEEDEDSDKVPVQQLIGQIKKRIDPAGVKEIVVRPLGEDHLEIIIPRVEDEAEADRIWNRAVQAGFLKFMIVADTGQAENTTLMSRAIADAPLNRRVYGPADDPEAYWVALGRERIPQDEGPDEIGAFKLMPSRTHALRDKRTGQIVNLPRQFDDPVDFTEWADETFAEGDAKAEIEILMLADSYNVEGEDLANVRKSIDERARPCVNFTLKPDGRPRMSRLTGRNEGQLLGIVLDNELLSAPSIETQIVGNGRITGQFTNEEVEDLVGILKAGKLPAAINKYPISRDQVSSSIGQELRDRGVFAIAGSFLIVVVFMLVYYRFAGVVACLALFTNMALILALILLIKQPITLTGLAGLVLTVGMSVDANVLIFERIREELDKGSTLRMAIRNGFGRATVTIVDANITTLITAMVLYAIGTEQIRGFCVALILGILMSMFTAIFCSRVTFDIAEKIRMLKELKMMRLVRPTTIDFIGKRKIAFALSTLAIVFGLFVSVVLLGDAILGTDLRGGQTARVFFKSDDLKLAQIRDRLPDEIEIGGKSVPLEWEVTEVTSTGDSYKPGTFFKFDSSLQPFDEDEWQGTDVTQDNYPTLQSILNEEFGDALKKYEVTITSSGNGDSNSTSSRTRPSPEMLVEANAIHSQSNDSQDDEAQNNEAQDNVRYVSYLPPSIGQDTSSNDTGSGDTGSNGSGGAGSGQDDTSQGDTSQGNGGSGDDGADGGQDAGGSDTQDQDTDAGSNSDQDPDDDDSSQDGDTNSDGDDQGDDAGAGLPPIGETGQDTGDTTTPPSGGSFTAQLDFGDSRTTKESILETMIDVQVGWPEEQARVSIDMEETNIVPTTDAVDVPSSTNWTITLEAPDKATFDLLLSDTAEAFRGQTVFSSLSQVGGQIAQESQVQALAAVLLSLVGIIAYIWVRFQRVVFGLAAVVALVHDVLIVIGAIAITGFLASMFGIPGFGAVKITLPVVAAFLTIIGYSLNDTIVVFDRIREVRGKNPDLTGDMINRSIGQTLSRTVLTSFTTFVVVFILLIFGGDAIQGFAFALTIGVIAGTYSSIFIASPVLLWLVQSQSKARQKRSVKTQSA